MKRRVAPRKKEKQVIAEVSLRPEEKTCTAEEGKASRSRGESSAQREGSTAEEGKASHSRGESLSRRED